MDMCSAMLCASPIVSLWSMWPPVWPGAFGFLKNFTFLRTNLYKIISGAVAVPQQLNGNAPMCHMLSGSSSSAGLFCASRHRQRTWEQGQLETQKCSTAWVRMRTYTIIWWPGGE